MKHTNRYRSVVVLFVLAAFIIVPLLDSAVCNDCRGNVSFGGEVQLRHSNAPHIDVTLCVVDDQDRDTQTSSDSDAKSICSICVNLAAGNFSSHSGPLHSVGPQTMRLLTHIALEPSFSINKPPQNSPVA